MTARAVASGLLAALLCGGAHADTLECRFTEPYITVRHDTAAGTVEVSGLGIEPRRFSSVGLTFDGVNRFELAWEGNRLLLAVDYEGSDLMSDHVFPISARWLRSPDSERPLHGGCFSERLPLIIPADLPE